VVSIFYVISLFCYAKFDFNVLANALNIFYCQKWGGGKTLHAVWLSEIRWQPWETTIAGSLLNCLGG